MGKSALIFSTDCNDNMYVYVTYLLTFHTWWLLETTNHSCCCNRSAWKLLEQCNQVFLLWNRPGIVSTEQDKRTVSAFQPQHGLQSTCLMLFHLNFWSLLHKGSFSKWSSNTQIIICVIIVNTAYNLRDSCTL